MKRRKGRKKKRKTEKRKMRMNQLGDEEAMSRMKDSEGLQG